MSDNEADRKKFAAAQMAYFRGLTGHSEGMTLALLTEFAEVCRRLNKLNEEDCDTGLSELSKRRETVLAKQAEELAAKLGCKLHHQGDPRGPAIRLIRPDGRSNLFDGETWHVRYLTKGD